MIQTADDQRRAPRPIDRARESRGHNRFLATGLLVLLSAAGPSSAELWVWTNGNGSGSWDTAANWDLGCPSNCVEATNVPRDDTAEVVIGNTAGGPGTVFMSTGRTIGSLTIQSGALLDVGGSVLVIDGRGSVPSKLENFGTIRLGTTGDGGILAIGGRSSRGSGGSDRNLATADSSFSLYSGHGRSGFECSGLSPTA